MDECVVHEMLDSSSKSMTVELRLVRLRSHRNIWYTVFAIRYLLYVYTGMSVHIDSAFFQCVPSESMKNMKSSEKKDIDLLLLAEEEIGTKT